MKATVNIAVAGAGLAGLGHIAAIRRTPGVKLLAVADPHPRGAEAARREGVPHYESLGALLTTKPKGGVGVVIATPTVLHEEHGRLCADAGMPMLVEKPIAADAAAGRRLCAAAAATGTPLLVGHHRRFNALAAAAKRALADGRLGKLTLVHAKTWLMKPDDYFAEAWRRRPGAGPVLINLIHDLDLLRHWCGEVESVAALESHAARGFEVEDAAAVLLRFESGALGTMSASDATAAPWSWELTARENPAYPATGESCYWLGGTRASLSLPDLTLWRHADARGWRSAIAGEKLVCDFGADPLVRQLTHFAAVVRGEEAPLVSGADALRSLTTALAVKRAAGSGGWVQLARPVV